jgi:Asp-tRNA(Asn)/Glu-tRNA(Gln) amidotransferase A subunit family amidase
MELLEPGFAVDGPADGVAGTPVIGRFRGLDVDPVIDAAIDRLLATTEFEVVDVDLPGWSAATQAGVAVLLAEAWRNDEPVLRRDPDGVGSDVRTTLELGQSITGDAQQQARARRDAWRAELAAVFARVEAIALPTIVTFPPLVGEDATRMVESTLAVNFAGHPSLALPVPTDGPLPASVQLMGPDNSEHRLLALGGVVEQAAASLESRR